MSQPAAVLIAASNLIQALRARIRIGGDVLTFTDTEPLEAVEAISRHRPPLVLLERLFAATPRGAALINRIKADPELIDCEIRVLSHDSDYSRVVFRRHTPSPSVSGATVPPAAPPPTLDRTGTRRALRYKVREGIEVQLDGSPAILVDLSMIGAQVVSKNVLRPNQRVRIVMLDQEEVIRLGAVVAWARFEMSRTTSAPQYRAGVEFLDADPPAIEAFCLRHKQ